jgi:hypothetical protein
MNDWDRCWTLFLDILGFNEFCKAAQDANYWLSLDVMGRALIALWLVTCTWLFCVRAVRVFCPGLGLPLRWSTMVGLGMWISTVGFHALRSIGAFNLIWASLACTFLGAVAVFAAPRRTGCKWAIARELRGVLAVCALARRRKYWAISTLFGVIAAAAAVRSLIVPPLGWDSITYHGPRAVYWLQTGQFSFEPGPGPLSFYRHFFSGAEVLSVWAMLPFHSDLLVNMATFVQWIGVGLSSWALARALGVREPYAATSGALVMFLPTLKLELQSGYVEAALNAALLNGIALTLCYLRRPAVTTAIAAAMSLGVAVGIKLTGVPPAMVALGALAIRSLVANRLPVSHRALALVLSLAASALPALPWTCVAFQETGYPLSPMPVKISGLTLGVPDPAMQWYQERMQSGSERWKAESQALIALFSTANAIRADAGPSLGTTAIVPLLVAVVGLIALVRRKRALMAAVVGAAMAVSVFTHFSNASSTPRLFWRISVARYLITLLGLAIIVSFSWCSAKNPLARTYRRLLLVLSLWPTAIFFTWGMRAWETSEQMYAGIVIWLFAIGCVTTYRRSRAIGTGMTIMSFALACSMLQLRRDQTRSKAYAESFALHTTYPYWAPAIKWVDKIGKPRRIAVTGGALQNADNWLYYFFFGARFQNRIFYVPPTGDGRIAHFRPSDDFLKRVDVKQWIKRLDDRHITEVITFAPYSVEKGWMQLTPSRFRQLQGGNDWGLYQVLPVRSDPISP